MLVDTDVLIWYLRGDARAAEALDDGERWDLPAVVYIELVQGMRSKQELRKFQRPLGHWGAKVILLDEAITTRAIFYLEQHFHAHGLRMADALIAATAVVRGSSLLTGNAKHYRVIPDLLLEPFVAG